MTTYEYTGEHLTTVTAPGNRITRYTYDTTAGSPRQHALRSVEYPDLRHDYFDYDGRGRLAATYSDGGAQRVTYTYDSAGTVTVQDATGRQTILRYGIGGQLAQVRDGEGRLVNFSYTNSQLGQLLGPGGERYRYAYDPRGNLSGIEDPLRRPSSFLYEPAFNRLARVTDARGNGLQYGYDPRGNLTTIAYADNTRETFGYDARGNVLTATNRRGGVINYRYNAAGQLTNKWFLTETGRVDFTYAYDAAGNLRSATGLEGTTSMDYYADTDRLRRIEYPGGKWFEFGYDDAGRRTSRLDQDGHRTHYVYDAVGRLDLMTNGLGQLIVDYDYDAAGRLQRKTLGNGVFTTYDYNGAGQITNLFNHKPDGSLLSRYEYTYDTSGRRTSMKVARGYTFAGIQMNARPHPGPLPQERGNAANLSGDSDALVAVSAFSPLEPPGASNFTTAPDGSSLSLGERAGVRASQSPLILAASSSAADTQLYGYDALGQLTRVEYGDGRVVEYVYDAAGNRTEVKDNGASTTYTPNALNQYTAVGDEVLLYDADGNLTNRHSTLNPQLSTSYFYDIENRLIGVTTPTNSWSYSYDAFGNRIATGHEGTETRYVIDPAGLGNVAAELDGSGNLVARYEHGFGLLTRIDAGDVSTHYTFSAIGHASELSDGAGGLANAYAFEPFGLSLAKAEAIPNSFEFVGEFGVMNEGTVRSWMRERDYDPGLGRFVTTDPIGIVGGLNLYAYVENNPTSGVDPLGLLFANPDGWRDSSSRNSRNLSDDYIGYDVVPRDNRPENLIHNYWFERINSPNERRDRVIAETGKILDVWQPILEKWMLLQLKAYSYGYQRFELPRVIRVLRLLIEIPSDERIDRVPVPVVRARDPNDKLAPAGYGASAFVRADSALAYQIRFENQPSATAPAQKIVITDTLDPNLDLSTFELTEITFAHQIIPVPMGLNHYEARLPFTAGTNSILAEVQAGLNLTTRELRLELRAIDPATGWFPEDPLTGLLYPNDATARGEGSLSYVVKPRADVPTGTVIRNRARIVFDFNDAIETPQVSNTIDSGAPTSSVTPLPAEAGPAILVQWSGQDDAGGSGLAGYDVYVIADGTNQFRWLERTTATSAWFSGLPGSTYAFYCIARDNVGQAEPAPNVPDAVVFIPTNAPVLADITNRLADVGNLMLITNTVTGTPIGSFLFSLGGPVPFGATINPTNGVLRWTPNCTQASRTHTITVLVTDTGNPNLRDLRTFTVTTRECVVPGLGRLVLQAGDSGRVPVNLISSVPLTNLSMTVETDSNRLINFSLEPIVPEICAYSIAPLSNSLHLIELIVCPNASLMGTQQVAWLYFTASSNQSSAFVGLHLDDTVGFAVDGNEVRNFAPQSGRIVVVGEEPLLEATIGTNNRPRVILYAKPGAGYVLETKTMLDPAIPWSIVWQGEQASLFQEIQLPAGTDRTRFFRALRRSPEGARLEANLTAQGQLNLSLRGQPGVRYRIESTTSLGEAAIWQSTWEGILTAPPQRIPLPTTNQSRFFRAVRE